MHQRPAIRLLLLTVILLAFTLFLHELTYQDIWWDEARNIDVALRPLSQVATAPELDIHPPLYFWALHSWLRLAQIDRGQAPEIIAFVARFLSVVGGLCAVVLLYPLGRRLHSPVAGLIAATIATTAPFWLAESQETRMYTVSFAMLTAAAWYLVRLTERAPRQPFMLNALAFVLLSTAALYTHYNAIFILVAWYAWWGVLLLFAQDPDRPFWQRLRPPLFCGLTTLALLVPIIPIALRQIPTYANPNLTIPTVAEYLWQNWQGYLGGYAFDATTLFGYSKLWLWTVLLIAAIGLLLPLRSSGTLSNAGRCARRSLLPVWLFGGLALYYIAVLDRGAFNVRYSSFVTPPLYLLLGIACANWARLRQSLVLIPLSVCLIGFIPATHADLYDPHFAREDVGDLADWLRQETGPDDLVLVDQKYPFGFYYGRYTIDAATTPTGPEAAPARYLFVDVNTLDAVLTAWAGNAKRVFWVQWFESDTDPRHAVRFLLDIYGKRAGERSFQGYNVDWWDLTPPTTFQLPSTWVTRSIRFADAVQTTELAHPAQVTAGAKLPVAIRWQRVPGGAVDRPLKARVALYDSADNRLAQADERLLNDRHRLPSEWDEREAPLNLYLLALPTDLPAGRYAVRLLVYDAETLAPLSIVDGAGNPAGIEKDVGTVEVQPAP